MADRKAVAGGVATLGAIAAAILIAHNGGRVDCSPAAKDARLLDFEDRFARCITQPVEAAKACLSTLESEFQETQEVCNAQSTQ